MIRKLLLASTATALLTGAAAAADLPRRAEPPPVFTPVPVFTWTGFYAGFNLGYAFSAQDNLRPTVANIAPGLTPGSSLFVTGAGAPAAGTLAFSNNANNFNGFSGG